MKTAYQPLRSFLFAPGNYARRVANALSLDADAVILDLEDAVATAEKPAARGAVAAVLALSRHWLLYVRVNAADTEFCYDDLVAIVRTGLDGIVLPKVESATALSTIDWLSAQLEREQDLAPGAVDLIPIIETAGGLTKPRRDPCSGHARQACRVWRGRFYPRREHGVEPHRGRAGLCSPPPRALPASRLRSTRFGSISRTRRASKCRLELH
jgi:citrate lyase subunit beta/citryl-CoA lyase